jgi:hypothetical protein
MYPRVQDGSETLSYHSYIQFSKPIDPTKVHFFKTFESFFCVENVTLGSDK